jgi:hypothetical protein
MCSMVTTPTEISCLWLCDGMSLIKTAVVLFLCSLKSLFFPPWSLDLISRRSMKPIEISADNIENSRFQLLFSHNPCTNPLLCIVALEGYSEITVSLNMDAMKLEERSTSKTSCCNLGRHYAQVNFFLKTVHPVVFSVVSKVYYFSL